MSSPGKPTLCENLSHPYHESQFEARTCNILSEFIHHKEILVPSQHKYKTKFDFIIPGIAIIEPHGIWMNLPNENSYFNYYEDRKNLASEYKELKDLPMVVISNSKELTYLKTFLQHSLNIKMSMNQFVIEMLEKYQTLSPSLPEGPETTYQMTKAQKAFALLGWGFTILLFILLWVK
ncbi:MAG: hypothetical protein ACXAC7_15325 [Candidatus Hodarchaeales archaeon]